DNNFRPLRHLNRLGSACLALVVFSVADDYERLAHRMLRLLTQQLFFAGTVHGVIEGSAASVLQAFHAHRKQRSFVGIVLRVLAVAIESKDKGLIEPWANHVLQKAG